MNDYTSLLQQGNAWLFIPSAILLGALHGLEPVSYTHLRAHETRHDLVCRLLLEKKKNTYTQLRAHETRHDLV